MNEKITEPISLSEVSRKEMLLIGKWARYIAISGFIIGGVTILFGVFSGLIALGLLSLGVDQEVMSNLPSWMGIFIYIVITGAYFIPFLLLYNFGIKIKAAILFSSEDLLASALSSLHQCFRFLAIITVTVMALFILVRILFGIAFVSGIL